MADCEMVDGGRVEWSVSGSDTTPPLAPVLGAERFVRPRARVLPETRRMVLESTMRFKSCRNCRRGEPLRSIGEVCGRDGSGGCGGYRMGGWPGVALAVAYWWLLGRTCLSCLLTAVLSVDGVRRLAGCISVLPLVNSIQSGTFVRNSLVGREGQLGEGALHVLHRRLLAERVRIVGPSRYAKVSSTHLCQEGIQRDASRDPGHATRVQARTWCKTQVCRYGRGSQG